MPPPPPRRRCWWYFSCCCCFFAAAVGNCVYHHQIISFMQSIYPYIPETNGVPVEFSVAATLLLLFMVHIALFALLNPLCFYISTFQSISAVPNMAVFCSSLISCLFVVGDGSVNLHFLIPQYGYLACLTCFY
jgi:hypothetical protein